MFALVWSVGNLVLAAVFAICTAGLLYGIRHHNWGGDDEGSHAVNCDGWHHPITGHCGDCGCFTCSSER